MSIEVIEEGLKENPKGVVVGIEDAKVVKVKKDSKYFQRFGPEVHFWDITVETTVGRVWFRTYTRELGEALSLNDKISTNVRITKVGEINPTYETRYLFGKLLTNNKDDVKIVKEVKDANSPPAEAHRVLIGV